MPHLFRFAVILSIIALVTSTPIEHQLVEGEGDDHSFSTQQHCGPEDWNAMKIRLRNAIARHPEEARWPARLLRAGFHDCFEGRCDASIAHELDRSENEGVEVTIRFLEHVTEGTCVTLADAIKIGLEVTMEIIGAPELNCRKGTEDAQVAGSRGQIPSETDDPQDILEGFRRKGFTTAEALAGNFGGHSIGRFDGKTFTPTESKYGNEFVQFIFENSPNNNGFNALPSDRSLGRHDDRGIVEMFAKDSDTLDTAFARFMQKLCSM